MPVGTILAYSGSLADIPNGWHLCDGTDGTPNLLDNRFLEGAANIGIYNEPGLPNITGYIENVVGNVAYSGALYTIDLQSRMTEMGGNFHRISIVLDASRSSAIYGNSNTVQPKSYTVYYIIKVK